MERTQKTYVSPSKAIVERIEIDRIFVVIKTFLFGKEVCDTIIEGVIVA